MTKITTYHTEKGVPYKGQATTFPLSNGKGIGFNFYPQDGLKIRCKIMNDSNEVIDRATDRVIGEYDPMWKTANLVLEEEPTSGGTQT